MLLVGLMSLVLNISAGQADQWIFIIQTVQKPCAFIRTIDALCLCLCHISLSKQKIGGTELGMPLQLAKSTMGPVVLLHFGLFNLTNNSLYINIVDFTLNKCCLTHNIGG